MTPDKAADYIKAMVRNDDIRMIVRGRKLEEAGERNPYFFVNEDGARVLSALGVGTHDSEMQRKSMINYDFGEHTHCVARESLTQVLGGCRSENTFKGIKTVPEVTREPALRR